MTYLILQTQRILLMNKCHCTFYCAAFYRHLDANTKDLLGLCILLGAILSNALRVCPSSNVGNQVHFSAVD